MGPAMVRFTSTFALFARSLLDVLQVLLPLLNQQAGWLTPSLAMAIVYVLSSLAATMLCESMQRIPGNFTFEHRFVITSFVHFPLSVA